MNGRRKEGESGQVEGSEEISLAQHPKGFGEISVSLTYLQEAGKANRWNEFEMLTGLEVKAVVQCGVGMDTHSRAMGYRYKTEFILREILEAEKHYTSFLGVLLFPTKTCLDRVWLS